MPHKYNEKMFDIKHLRETAEKLKNWGRWGPEDEIGTLNFITPEKSASFLPIFISVWCCTSCTTTRSTSSSGTLTSIYIEPSLLASPMMPSPNFFLK